MPPALPHCGNDQRRARIGVRHALAGSARVATPEQVVTAMTVLHSTEPATVFLSCWARSAQITRADVERALYVDRTVVKQLAMRRTLFVFPRELLPAAWGSASARVAGAERRRIAKDVVLAGISDDGEAWLDEARAGALALSEAAEEGVTALEVRAGVPAIAVSVSPGSTWNHSRVLTHLGLTAELVRGINTQHWRLSRPRWTPMARWLGEQPDPLDERAGYAEIVRRWLHTFGPGTEADLVWWLGGTKAAVRAALSDVEAVEVGLDGGGTGWLLPDDLEPVAVPEPWVALLPVLDPTTMGWKQRDLYLGPHTPLLFDRNGNAGTTAWVNGRVVGCWVQDADDPACPVRVRLVEDVEPWARAALLAEAERLTAWLGGERVGTVYPSVAMRDPDLATLRP